MIALDDDDERERLSAKEAADSTELTLAMRLQVRGGEHPSPFSLADSGKYSMAGSHYRNVNVSTLRCNDLLQGVVPTYGSTTPYQDSHI